MLKKTIATTLILFSIFALNGASALTPRTEAKAETNIEKKTEADYNRPRNRPGRKSNRNLKQDGKGPYQDGKGPRGTNLGAKKDCPKAN